MHLWMTSQGEQLSSTGKLMVGRRKFRIWNSGRLFSGANLFCLVLGVVYFLEWFSQESRFGERC